MSKLEVDAIEPQSGTTLTLGASGDTVTFASGANLSVDGTIKLDGYYPVGTENVAFGDVALSSGSLTGGRNTAIGGGSLLNNTTGCCNTAVGYLSLGSNTSGQKNTAIGFYSSFSNTTGSNNTSFGWCSFRNNTSGASNVAIGYESLKSNTTACNNTAVGHQSLCANTTGTENTALGESSLFAATTASYNTGLGIEALCSLTTGFHNLSVGRYAGCNITTGGQNINIGTATLPASATDNYSLVIGYNIVGKGSATGYIAPDGASSNGIYQGNNSSSWSTTSDRRIKKNITDNTIGLEKINQIQVRNFEYRTPDEITELPKHSAINKQGIQVGVIAQEIEEILPDVVKTESTGVKSVNPDNITWYLVNAIKELKAEIDELKNK